MFKSTIIILVISVVITMISILPRISDSCNLWFRELIDNQFYVSIENDNFDMIYHSHTYHMLNDSLVEYYWKGNYIIIGESKLTSIRSNILKNMVYREPLATQKAVYIYRLPNNKNGIEDTLTIVDLKLKSDDNSLISLYLNCDTRVALIYGKDIFIDDAANVACLLYCGLLREKILDYNSNTNLNEAAAVTEDH